MKWSLSTVTSSLASYIIDIFGHLVIFVSFSAYYDLKEQGGYFAEVWKNINNQIPVIGKV